MSKQAAVKWTRADFRLHPGHLAPEPHWLVRHLYGRVLLASELRRVRPDLDCPRYTPDHHSFPQLDGMIDRLELRKWPRPCGFGEHLQVLALLTRMFWALEMSRALPSWNSPLVDRADEGPQSAS
jgi:hypothetical protein